METTALDVTKWQTPFASSTTGPVEPVFALGAGMSVFAAAASALPTIQATLDTAFRSVTGLGAVAVVPAVSYVLLFAVFFSGLALTAALCLFLHLRSRPKSFGALPPQGASVTLEHSSRLQATSARLSAVTGAVSTVQGEHLHRAAERLWVRTADILRAKVKAVKDSDVAAVRGLDRRLDRLEARVTELEASASTLIFELAALDALDAMDDVDDEAFTADLGLVASQVELHQRYTRGVQAPGN